MKRQLVADYGHDVTSAEGVRAFRTELDERLLSIEPQPPRPCIKSEGHYVAIVRRMFPNLATDGRLIAPLWRDAVVRPSEWREGGKAQDWIAYWNRTQERPDRIWSPYNGAPAGVARAWQMGIEEPLSPSLYCLLPKGWRGGRERVRAIRQLSRKLRGEEMGLTNDAKTVDLRRLARLSGALLRATDYRVTQGGKPNWEAIAENHRRFIGLPRELLQEQRVPASRWLRLEAAGTAFRAQQRGISFDAAVEEVRCLQGERRARRQAVDPYAPGQALARCRRVLAERHERKRRAIRGRHDALRRQWAQRGLLVGWRGWRLQTIGEPVLVSPIQYTPWAGPELVADRLPDHSRVRGEHGIHAAWSRHGDVYSVEFIGRVRGHGAFVAGREGWRAERVIIDRLLCTDPEIPDEVLEQIGDRYGVAVGRTNRRHG